VRAALQEDALVEEASLKVIIAGEDGVEREVEVEAGESEAATAEPPVPAE
jgi:hypothetical protein